MPSSSTRLLVLSLDTATDVATTCLARAEPGGGTDVLAETATRGRSTAAQRVLADVDHVLRSAGAAPGDLGLIVVGTGPGTFTGLRIGIATARGLGAALSV